MSNNTFTVTPGMIACAKEWGHSEESMAAFDTPVWRLFDPARPENRKENHRAYKVNSLKPTSER